MSDLWFAGNQDRISFFGGDSPDPVNPLADPTWTWQVSYSPDINQTTYARTSVNTILDAGGGYVFSGINRYQKQNSDGSTDWVVPGAANANGVADFIWDTGVFAVVFAFGIGSSGGATFEADINLEVWVTQIQS
jgi:hypothetical protein